MIKGILRMVLCCWSILILTFKTENVFGWFEGRRACWRSDHHHQAQSVRAHDDYYKIKSAG